MILSIISYSYACGDSLSTDWAGTTYTSQAAGGVATEEEAPTKFQGSIASLIANDLSGGMFVDSSAVEADVDEAEINSSKASLNVPIETREFTVDRSYLYVGKNGEGRFTLSAYGNGEDRESTTDTTQSRIYDYESLTLRLLFDRYHFLNECLGDVYLHGEIRCEVEGTYTLNNKFFRGTSDCINGPKEEPKNILYIANEETHEVALNLHIDIQGDPFNTGSFVFTGNFVIDGETKSIEELDQKNECKR